MNEPILMQNQSGALNEDVYAQTDFLIMKAIHGLTTAVETGTCLGYTAEFLAKNYDHVHTIEVNEKYADIAYENRLKYYNNVSRYIGSSVDVLPDILKNCDDNTFFFLDAHWNDYCPLLDELKHIASAKIKPVIAIHDFFVPDRPEYGYDSINGHPFDHEFIKKGLELIYGEGGYIISYNREAVGAKRGIAYIVPKK
jgi:predicted O-methyltransferase YrrM